MREQSGRGRGRGRERGKSESGRVGMRGKSKWGEREGACGRVESREGGVNLKGFQRQNTTSWPEIPALFFFFFFLYQPCLECLRFVNIVLNEHFECISEKQQDIPLYSELL